MFNAKSFEQAHVVAAAQQFHDCQFTKKMLPSRTGSRHALNNKKQNVLAKRGCSFIRVVLVLS
jgi:hypothetical protein